MSTFNPQQRLLLSAEYLLDINPLKKYKLLFDNLDCSPFKRHTQHAKGRPSVPQPGLLRALIYKNLKPLPTLYDLAVDLVDNPSITLKCNLAPSHHLALVERFSSFLKDTPNIHLQIIRKRLVQELIELGQIKGNLLAIDSCPLLAKVKENNLKTSVKNRFNKTKTPKGDPDCRLGVIIHFPKPFEKEVRFFFRLPKPCYL